MPKRSKSRSRPAELHRSFELERFVPYLMTQIYHRLNKSFAASLRPLNLLPAQWRVLANLADRDSRTFTQLLQYTALDQPTLSRTVARLVRNGHVTRKRKAEDGRAIELSLTSSGRRLWRRALPVGENQYRLAVRGVSATDQRRLALVLGQVFQNLHRIPRTQRIRRRMKPRGPE